MDFSDERSTFDGLQKTIICLFISFLSLQLHKFLQSKIMQTFFQFKKVACIIPITDKKIISVFYVSWVLCFPP